MCDGAWDKVIGVLRVATFDYLHDAAAWEDRTLARVVELRAKSPIDGILIDIIHRKSQCFQVEQRIRIRSYESLLGIEIDSEIRHGKVVPNDCRI